MECQSRDQSGVKNYTARLHPETSNTLPKQNLSPVIALKYVNIWKNRFLIKKAEGKSCSPL